MRGANSQYQQFLSFNLTVDLQALLPTEQIGEIVNLDPCQIVPIFEMPEAVMGVWNHRGEVAWLVDLAHLLGLEPLFIQEANSLHSVILIQQQQAYIGLAIRQIGQLVLCKTHQIHDANANESQPKLSFCLDGLYRNMEGKTILVLDGGKIMQLLKQS